MMLADKTTATSQNVPELDGKSTEGSKPECPHCRPGHQYYRMIYNLYKFDVDRAIEIVQDGRESFELSDEDVDHSMEWSSIYEEHLEHVDTSYPGIICHYWYPQHDGTMLQGHVLVDGHHRAVKARRLGQPFRVVVLSEEESRSVTLRAPTSPDAITQAIAERKSKEDGSEVEDGESV